jgi:predicted GNAT family acetyltransferase
MDHADVKVNHNEARSRFETEVDGQLAVAEYRLEGDVLCLTHTVVPEPLEGRGIASTLIRDALAHARQQGLKVRPSCAFAAAYVKRHPDAQDLVVS